ncbi:MAG: hypothetical protein EOP83_04185 [Verrucomicrobiaceae bacterium]|nr:MAG: hypothetical protein EOP83_04185 [Verrucomicrobiaceae bacterium]
MNVIALVGFIGSGKDTVGRHLVEAHGYYDMAFADALKDTCAAIFCWDRIMLDGKNPQSREWRDQIDTWWADHLDIPHFTPRWALQNVGTGVLRAHFNDALWILNVKRRIMAAREQHGEDVRIVLTDGRFPNELSMVRELGGTILRIKRGYEPIWYETAREANAGDLSAINRMSIKPVHISEWAWVGYDFDRTLSNDGTVDYLFQQVDAVLRR